MLSCGGGGAVTETAADSDVSLLSSPALRTLFGLLARGPPGDAAPPVVVEPGRLSPTRLLMRDSISRRLSALLGVGDINWRWFVSSEAQKSSQKTGIDQRHRRLGLGGQHWPG